MSIRKTIGTTLAAIAMGAASMLSSCEPCEPMPQNAPIQNLYKVIENPYKVIGMDAPSLGKNFIFKFSDPDISAKLSTRGWDGALNIEMSVDNSGYRIVTQSLGSHSKK